MFCCLNDVYSLVVRLILDFIILVRDLFLFVRELRITIILVGLVVCVIFIGKLIGKYK